MTTNEGTTLRSADPLDWQYAMRGVCSHRGATLEALSSAAPTLVVFLRHAGCVFCREALADLQAQRAAIEALGVRLALVHMSEPLNATLQLERYGLGDVHRFSDPECRLYRAFSLERGGFRQLFGARVIWRGLVALVRGCSVGRLEGDGFRLSGVFLLEKGRVVAEHRAATAADRPDYVQIARRGCAAAAQLARPAPASAARQPV